MLDLRLGIAAVGVRKERPDRQAEVVDARVAEDVGAVRLGDVDAEDEVAGAVGLGVAPSDGLCAVVVQPHPVDERAVGGQAWLAAGLSAALQLPALRSMEPSSPAHQTSRVASEAFWPHSVEQGGGNTPGVTAQA